MATSSLTSVTAAKRSVAFLLLHFCIRTCRRMWMRMRCKFNLQRCQPRLCLPFLSLRALETRFDVRSGSGKKGPNPACHLISPVTLDTSCFAELSYSTCRTAIRNNHDIFNDIWSILFGDCMIGPRRCVHEMWTSKSSRIS